MSLLMIVASTVFLLAPTASALTDHTWWVDSSCDSYNVVNAAKEAFATAGMIWERLPADDIGALQQSPAANAFKTLFARDSGDAWYLTDAATVQLGNLFGGGPHSLSKFVQNTENQLEAEIRIYCDNDARWEIRKDDPKQPSDEGTPNSQRDPDTEQEWLDSINQILIKGKPVCSRDGNDVDAVTYGRISPYVDSSSQHPNRVSITLCDHYLKHLSRIATFTDDIPKKKLFSKGSPDTVTSLNQIVSMKIFHELMHHSRYRKEDVPQGSNDAYGWSKCVDKSDDDQNKNADNWALLATLIQCMERNFWIDPKNPKSGNLVYNKDMPARASAKKLKMRELLDWLPEVSKMKRTVLISEKLIIDSEL